MEEEIEEIKEKSIDQQLREKLATDREFINTDYRKIMEQMEDLDKLGNTEVKIASLRHYIIDRICFLENTKNHVNRNTSTTRKKKFEYYKTEHHIKISEYNINAFIDADLEALNNYIDQIEKGKG